MLRGAKNIRNGFFLVIGFSSAAVFREIVGVEFGEGGFTTTSAAATNAALHLTPGHIVFLDYLEDDDEEEDR